MLIKRPEDVKSTEITDQRTYLNRRQFMHQAGAGAIGGSPNPVGGLSL